jgi:hypothetical protein
LKNYPEQAVNKQLEKNEMERETQRRRWKRRIGEAMKEIKKLYE